MKRVKQHTGVEWGTFYKLEKHANINPEATPIEDLLKYGFENRTYKPNQRIIEMSPVTRMYILGHPRVKRKLVEQEKTEGGFIFGLDDAAQIQMLYFSLNRQDVKFNMNNQILENKNYKMPIGEIFFGVTNHLTDWCWEEFCLCENNLFGHSSIQETFTMNFITVKESNDR